jgi:hypothetical protein
MTLFVVTPQWETFRGNVNYVEPKFADLDGKSWIGTQRDYWLRSAVYMEELAGREDMPDMPDAYELLAENARRMARGEAPQWSVDVLGYERARELEDTVLVPGRGRWYVQEDGSEINRNGGISDGDYVNFRLYLGQLFRATLGINNLGNTQTTAGVDSASGKTFRNYTVEEQRDQAERSGLPFQIIEMEEASA